MRSRRVLLVGLLLLADGAVGDDGWVTVGESEVSTDSIKLDTLELSTNKADERVAAAVGRQVSKTGTVTIRKWYVRTADCEAGYGKLVTLSTSGEFIFDNDFAEGSGSMASGKAEALCYFYKAVKANREAKSL